MVVAIKLVLYSAMDTAKGVYAKMDELKKRFPEGLDYRIVYDTTPFIRESINEVFNTLRDAILLVHRSVIRFPNSNGRRGPQIVGRPGSIRLMIRSR